MSKKSSGKKISEKEKARRAAASAQAQSDAHVEVRKVAGKDAHFDLTKPRLMRHQGR
jgi:hypothetical protein